jgi:CheY-like chemotaxis protein
MIDHRNGAILIADHEDDWRDLLVMVIQRRGYGTVEAKTGREAIDRAMCETPGLILLDSALPDINGQEVMTHLRRNAATQNIPVVFQLPAGSEESIRYPQGVKEVLYKPFDLGDLPGILRKYLPEPRLIMIAMPTNFSVARK